jgi:glycosyltransferase involved in cell wall biosynthesis
MGKTLMIGPSAFLKGGIASYIKNFIKDDDFLYCPTKRETTLGTVGSYLFIIYYLLFYNIDTVHINVSKGGSVKRKFIAFLFAKCFFKRTLIHVHSSEMPYDLASSKLNSFLFYTMISYSRCIFVSLSQMNDFISNCNIPSEIEVNEFEFIYNPYDRNSSHITCESPDNSIVFSGLVVQKKGVETLIDYFISESSKEDFLYIAGNYERHYLEYIKNKYQKCIRFEFVIFLGWLENDKLLQLISDNAYYCLPSLSESFGYSLIEASSLNVKCICSDLPVFKELDLPNCFYIDKGNSMSDVFEQARSTSLTRIRNQFDRFSFETHKKKLGKIYRNVK